MVYSAGDYRKKVSRKVGYYNLKFHHHKALNRSVLYNRFDRLGYIFTIIVKCITIAIDRMMHVKRQNLLLPNIYIQFIN